MADTRDDEIARRIAGASASWSAVDLVAKGIAAGRELGDETGRAEGKRLEKWASLRFLRVLRDQSVEKNVRESLDVLAAAFERDDHHAADIPAPTPATPAPTVAARQPRVPWPLCRGCGKPLLSENNVWCADGCPCNSRRGINHGIVPKDTCTCVECDPAQTGSVRGAAPTVGGGGAK